MSYKVKIEAHEEHLEAFVIGDRKLSTAAQDTLCAIAKIAQACRLHHLKKILIVWDLIGKIDKEQALILISNLEKYQWSREFKSASVHPNLENYKSNTFTQTVIDNLGWNTKIFQDKETAMKWLFK